jgi:hypothetical protein
MFNNLKLSHLIIIGIIILLIIIMNKNVEAFEFPKYYPISYQNDINIGNTILSTDKYDSDTGHIINYDLSHLIRIINQTRILANGENKLDFNKQYLPVIIDDIDKNKLTPIINYISSLINKLGNGLHIIKVNEIKDASKEETDYDMRISFDINVSYYRVLNDSYYENKYLIKNKEKVKLEGIEGNAYKIQDVVIKAVVIATKNVIDDIFTNNKNDIQNMYISKLYIMGLMDDEYLPGSNISEFDLYWNQNIPLTNRIVDERLVRDLKTKHENKVSDLTRKLPTF